MTEERRQPEQAFEEQVQGTAVRMVREGGSFRESDTPAFKEQVAKKLQSVATEVGKMTNSVIESQRIADFAERFISEFYQPAYESLVEFNVISRESFVPKSKTVEETLKRKLTAEQLEEIEGFKKPVLLLRPKKKWNELRDAFDEKRKSVRFEGPTSIDDGGVLNHMFYDIPDPNGVPEFEWQILITEGVQNLPDLAGDSNYRTMGERLDWFQQRYVNRGIQTNNLEGYVLLCMLQFIKNPRIKLDRPLNGETRTILSNISQFAHHKKIPDTNTLVACDMQGSLWVRAFNRDFKDEKGDMRFRLTVAVDVD